MRKRPLVRKLFPVYFLITLASVLVIGLYAFTSLRAFYYAQTEQDLLVRAKMISGEVAPDGVLPKDAGVLRRLARTFAGCADMRVTIISPSGTVLADSESVPARMENHSDRPEFQQAMAKGSGTSRRVSPTLRITMVYAAVPIAHGGRPVAVLRVAEAATAVDARPALLYTHLALAAILVMVVAAVASVLAARRITAPILQLREAAERFAGGDFSTKAPVPDSDELAGLADTLNTMASQLGKQLRTITQQYGERAAILSSMKEAVLALDASEKILILNPSAERLLGISMEASRGKAIQAVVRNTALQRFLESSFATEGTINDEIMLYGDSDTLVQAVGAPLIDADGHRIGALVVLDDITQTRKLETMRKDFVANVSHELRTPITSIKGFVETLRDGVIDDPEKSKAFLTIVARQADRLAAIIEDLLALSVIEQKAERAEIETQPASVCEVLQAAVADCRQKAEAGGVTIELECADDLTANANPPLLEQAIANLLDNAIKYGPAQGTITVRAEGSESDVGIHVIDRGPGIEAEFIPRLFERFYRVDKARSRKHGGTGLGLAIVKHIAQAHGGRVEVRSKPGEGSTFSIHLPRILH